VPRRIAVSLSAAAALTAGVPAVASAATTRVSFSEGIRVEQEQDGTGEMDSLLAVRWDTGDAGTVIVVRDNGQVPILAGQACAQRSTTEVACPVPNTGKLRIFAGRGNDSVNLTELTVGVPGGGKLVPVEVHGGAGADQLGGTPAPDVLNGDGLAGNGQPPAANSPDTFGGDDILLGMAGDDTLTGGQGSDWFFGSAETGAPLTESNILDGGTGSDVFVLGANPGPDDVRGGSEGEGNNPSRSGQSGLVPFSFGENGDIATYENRTFTAAGTAGVTVTLDGTANDGVTGEGDKIGVDVENVRGSVRDDTITGDDHRNALSGMLGSDKLIGRGGDDVLKLVDGVADKCPDAGTGTNTVQADLADQPVIDACTPPPTTSKTKSSSLLFIPNDEKTIPATVGARLGVRALTVRVPLSCPRSPQAACAGTVALSVLKSRKPLAKASYRVAVGRTKTISVRVGRTVLARLRRSGGAVVTLVEKGSSKKGPKTVQLARRLPG